MEQCRPIWGAVGKKPSNTKTSGFCLLRFLQMPFHTAVALLDFRRTSTSGSGKPGPLFLELPPGRDHLRTHFPKRLLAEKKYYETRILGTWLSFQQPRPRLEGWKLKTYEWRAIAETIFYMNDKRFIKSCRRIFAIKSNGTWLIHEW